MREHVQVRHRRDDEGLTLVELLISMTIFSIVIALTYALLINVQRQTSDTVARADSTGDARVALAQIDRQVRSGNVLYSPSLELIPGAAGSDQCQPSTDATRPNAGTCMRVYTQANGLQKCIQWQVQPALRILRVRSWSPTWSTDGQVSGWGVVARNVTNTPGTPAFALASGGQYGSRLMDVSLLIKNPKARGSDVQVTSSLSGRNTAYGFDPGICLPIPPA